MNPKALNLVTIVLLSLLGIALFSYSNSIKGDYSNNYGEMVPVLRVIKGRGIFELDPITADRLETFEVPRRIAPLNAIKSLSELKAGAVAAINILDQQIVTKAMIVYRDQNNAELLERKIAVGKRALTIPITEISAAGRMFLPGDRVDIAYSVRWGDTRCEREVKFAFEDIMILAVGTKIMNTIPQRLVNDERSGQKTINFLRAPGETLSFSTVTLEVTVDQAQSLGFIYSENGGFDDLILVLRNSADRARTETKPVNIIDLVAAEKRDKVCNNKTASK